MSKYAGRIQKYVNVDSIDMGLDGFNLVQPKHDGWWARVVCNSSRRAEIYSRQCQLKAHKQVGLDCPQMTLIGEYCVGTNRTKSGLEREETVVVFDVIELDGKNVAETLPYARRLDLVERLSEYADWLVPVVTKPISHAKKMWQSWVIDGGCEGLVFRNSKDPYTGATIGRLKREFTLDYVVLGMEEGQGKLRGMAGVLLCGMYVGGRMLQLCRVGGGMDNNFRTAIWKKPSLIVGKVVEVKGWQVFDYGALRHPQFSCIREDKSPAECVWKGAVL